MEGLSGRSVFSFISGFPFSSDQYLLPTCNKVVEVTFEK